MAITVLNTTARLHHRTVVPPTITREQALSLFRKHDILIQLDPEFSSYEEIPAPPGTSNEKTKFYKVTDIMHALPAHLWDSTVSFTAEITDIENGVEWIVHAPLGLTQNTLFTVQDAGEKDVELDDKGREGRLVLVEDVEIRCSRLLIGTVKSKIEGNWRGIHKRWIEHLEKVET
jgi:hypothetical protein